MKTRHEVFGWTEIASFLGVAGMNIFQLVQGITGIGVGIIAIVYGYWRVRATRAKALAREAGLMGEDRRK